MKRLICTLAAVLCLAGAKAQTPVPGGLLDGKAFETEIEGKKVALYTISNGTITAQITNYGGYIVGLFTPDKDGRYDNIVGHNDSIQQYLGFSRNPVGPALGRYANRIGNATFTLDGVEYHVTRNNGEHILHGGNKAFDRTVWDVERSTADSLVLSCVLEDGQDGFPGNIRTTLTFAITPDNGLMIDYSATTDKPTVCSMSHHAYFNLEGFDGTGILDHVITIRSSTITEADRTLIPTGRFLPVDGTVNDFRNGVRLGDRQMAPPSMQGGFRPGMSMPEVPEGMVRSYDQNFCLDRASSDGMETVASLYSPVSGRRMEIINNHPGLQLYTGNRRAIAMESQMYPDSPNRPEFPSTILRPGETYRHTVIYRFSVSGNL